MKKNLFITMLLLLLFVTTAPLAFADTAAGEPNITTETINFDDGSYATLETTIEESLERASKKTASSTYTYYSSNKVKQWSFTLKGTFAYNGSTAKALSSSKDKTVSNGWSCSSLSSKVSGASATAHASFKKKTVVKSGSIKLTCSPSGKITATKY